LLSLQFSSEDQQFTDCANINSVWKASPTQKTCRTSFARTNVEVLSLTLKCVDVSVIPTLKQHWGKQQTNSKVTYLACKLIILHLMENGVECAQTNNVTGNLAIFCFKFSTYNFYLTDFNSHVWLFSAMSPQLIVQMIWSDIKSPSHHLCKLTSSPNTALFCPLIITSKDCQLSYIVRT
jgi:hypothetical protein